MRNLVKLAAIIIAIFWTINLHAQNIIQSIRSGDIETVKSMVEENPDLINNPEFSLSNLVYAVRFNQPEIVKYLISKGADIDYSAPHSQITPIWDALRTGNLKMIKLLVEKGGNINHVSRLKESYLHFAASFNNVEIAKYLIEKGVNIDIAKTGNITPLHIAAVTGKKEMVEFLISKGADLDIKSTDGGTALHFAKAARNEEIAEILISKGAKQTKRKFPKYKGAYLGQELSGNDPEMFVPELFLDIYRPHSALAFSPDGTEVFWECMFTAGSNENHKVWYMRMENGVWQAPELAPFADNPSGGPAISPDGNMVVFHNMQPTEQEPDKKDIDLWYAIKADGKWSDAKHLGYEVNSNKEFEVYPYWGDDNTIYFRSRRDIKKSKAINGVFQKPESLGDLFNSNYVDDCKEKEFLIFYSDKRKERFFYELYICFHNEDGTWSPGKHMGDKLHQGRRATGNIFTHDKKYIFFSSNFISYWMDAQIIDDLK